MTPTELFAALANDTRLRCLVLLVRQGELCVCELTHALGVVQPQISRHLAQLRELGLVSDRRDGLWVYYRVRADLPPWVGAVLQSTVSGLHAEPPFAEDDLALSRMPNRPSSVRCA